MHFSHCIKHGGLVALSPNNTRIASSKGKELNVNALLLYYQVYTSHDLSLLSQFTFEEPITRLEWSRDSTFILAGIFKKRYCEIKSLEQPQAKCSIDEGIGGMESAQWSPDSCHVLTVCDCNIHLTIWSLIDNTFTMISHPKYADKCISFNSTGAFMALAERKECHDYIGLYYAKDWSLARHFVLESIDLNEMTWLKDDSGLIVTDYAIESKVYVYSLEGHLVSIVAPYETIHTIGVDCMFLSPKAHYVAFSFLDKCCLKMYGCFTWKLITTFRNKISPGSKEVIRAFKEEMSNDEEMKSKYVQSNLSLSALPNKSNSDTKGIAQVEWSFDEIYIAMNNDATRNVLWIWDLKKLELHTVIVQLKDIKDFKWSPIENQLAIVSECSAVSLFTLNNIKIYDWPLKEAIFPQRIHWSSDGKEILLMDKTHFIKATLEEVSILQQYTSEFNS